MGLPNIGAALRRGVFPADGLEKGISMRTIEQKLAIYGVTLPVSMSHRLNDEEIENGLLWVSDAVRGSHLREALGYQAAQHFANEVLPEEFWKGIKEHQETIPV